MKDNETTIIKKSIIENLSQGNSVEGTCKKVKINKTTFYEWVKKDKQFAEDVEKARLSQVVVVEDALFKKAKAGNVTAIIFFLCNRSPEKWKNVQRVETEFPDGLKIILSNIPRPSEQRKIAEQPKPIIEYKPTEEKIYQ